MFLFLDRVYDLQFVDEIMKIEAHEAEILCVEFSDPKSGMNFTFILYSLLSNTEKGTFLLDQSS